MSAITSPPFIQPIYTQRLSSKDEVPLATLRKRSRNDTPEYRNKVQKLSKDALSGQKDDVARSDLCSRGKEIIYRWTDDEDEILTNAIKKYGLDWKEVATFLPGRDRFACRSRYTNKLRKDDWSPPTKVEIDMIHKLAQKNNRGEYNWNKICINVNKAFNRIFLVRPPGFIQKVFYSTKQDYKSYQIENDSPPITTKPSQQPTKKIVSKKRLKRTSQTRKKWSQNEDEKLKKAVLEHGQDWSLIARLMPGRNRKNCRSRYLDHLNCVDLSPFSSAEMSLIKRLAEQRLYRHDDGRYKWAAICKKVNEMFHESTPKRTAHTIKNVLLKGPKRKTELKSKQKVGSKISASSSSDNPKANNESPQPLLSETPLLSASSASSFCKPFAVEQRTIVPNILNKEGEDLFPILAEGEPCSPTDRSLQSIEPIETCDFSLFKQSLMPRLADHLLEGSSYPTWQEEEGCFSKSEEDPMSPLPETDLNMNWDRELLSNVVV